MENKKKWIDIQQFYYDVLFCLKTSVESRNIDLVKKQCKRLNDLTKYLLDENTKQRVELHHCYKRLKELEEANTDLLTEKWKNSLKDKEIYKQVRDRLDLYYSQYNEMK